MGLFIRSSISLIQCTKRMLCNAVAENAVPVFTPKSRKILHLRSIIETDLMINQKLKHSEIIEGNQWAEIREELLTKLPKLSETTIDSQIYDICFHYNKLDQVINYFKFLESNNYKLNLSTVGSYLKVYFIRKKPITVEEEDEICRIYDYIQKHYPLLDGKTCSDCILAISLTKRWKESLKLLEMLKLASSPRATVMSAIITAAFRNNDAQLGWKIMTETVAKIPLDNNVYLDYLNYCKKSFEGYKLQEELEKMFNFWRDYDVTPTHPVIKAYADFFESLGYTATYTTVSKKGCCSNCKHYLEPTTLSKTDFKMLSKSIMKNVIVGDSIYCITSPQELKRYMLFIKSMKPYDVVIDGLNVAYASRKPGQPGSLKHVLHIVNFFTKVKKRVLVIGRVHMNWWSKETMKSIQEKADVFLMKNMSQDDPFLLHISLISGPQTCFVSRDLMRQHKHKLDDSNLQRLFKNWQMSRQYMFHKTEEHQIRLLPPIPFDINPQKDINGWHIPYSYSVDLMLPQIYTVPEHWVCIRKNDIPT